ncbi:MAG: hypothetical protein WD757_04005 [Actinomycetota bacterium]
MDEKDREEEAKRIVVRKQRAAQESRRPRLLPRRKPQVDKSAATPPPSRPAVAPVSKPSSAPTPAAPEARAPSTPSRYPASVVCTIVGGAICAFGPLFPWWQESLGDIQTLDPSSFGGLQAWPGLVAEALGVLILVLGILLFGAPEKRKQLNVGSGVMAAGGGCAALALFAIVGSKNLFSGEVIGVRPLPFVYLTLVGGLLAAVGGYLLMREAQRG